MFERELRTLAFVPRWSIIRTIRQQSVAEHSFFVAIYADQIAELISWTGSRYNLMRLAMFHDMDETLSGDIASPSKSVLNCSAFRNWSTELMLKRFPYFNDWLQSEPGRVAEALAILHVADWLEGVLFLCDEEFMGNGNPKSVRIHCTEKLGEAIQKLPTTVEVKTQISQLIRETIAFHLVKCDALAVDENVHPDCKDYMQQALSESEEGEA